jgi:hypothetical protein
MRKGQMAITAGLVLLVTAIVGLYVVDSITSPFCMCLDSQTAENSSIAVSVWNNYTCDGEKCESDYRVVCDGTELELGVDYDIDDCNYMVTNITYDGEPCILYYTYEGSYYHGDDILGTIMCNLIIIAAIGVLALAGAWLWMR